MTNENHVEHLNVTLIVEGKPKDNVKLSGNEKVLAVIREYLPQSEKKNAANYLLVDRRLGTKGLPLDKSLFECGVENGDVLSITKNDGGGGEHLDR